MTNAIKNCFNNCKYFFGAAITDARNLSLPKKVRLAACAILVPSAAAHVYFTAKNCQGRNLVVSILNGDVNADEKIKETGCNLKKAYPLFLKNASPAPECYSKFEEGMSVKEFTKVAIEKTAYIGKTVAWALFQTKASSPNVGNGFLAKGANYMPGYAVEKAEEVWITPVYAAVAGKNNYALKALMKKEIDCHSKGGYLIDEFGQKHEMDTPLNYAIQEDDYTAFQEIVQNGKTTDLNHKTFSKKGHYEWVAPPLYKAAHHNRLQEASVLIDKGVDVNAPRGDGYYPIHMAIYFKNIQMLKNLLQAGANPTVKSNEGTSCMDIAFNKHRVIDEKSKEIGIILENAIAIWEKKNFSNNK